jgi:hypothetical protein
VHHYETYLGQAADPGTVDNLNTMPVTNAFGDYTSTTADDAQWHGGIVNYTNTHAMTLAFGGIKGAKDANSSQDILILEIGILVVVPPLMLIQI